MTIQCSGNDHGFGRGKVAPGRGVTGAACAGVQKGS
jgi:hypothetical protein